jgi:ATP-dependent RNA helicase DeaD
VKFTKGRVAIAYILLKKQIRLLCDGSHYLRMETTIKFNELGLADYIMKAVEDLGFEDATPIQSAAIPVILSGRDVIGQAQTGTGKTAAFGIPAIEHVDADRRETQVLILCPTRELALQVKEQVTILAKHKKGLLVTAIFGGESYDRQLMNLKKGTQIVVGTPGRVMDHIERKTLKLDSISMFILDEADEMLNMGFREDIEEILKHAPQERQTVLFSATMSKDILNITKKFQKDPELIKVTKKEVTNENIEQTYYNVRKEAKFEVMTRLIDVHELQLMLVFCNTKSKVDEVVIELQEAGYAAEGLHGDLRQASRNQVMNKFRNGNTKILVATDVAARGIDVSGVDAVFNFDLPMDLEYYVHRIGRTGRAGKLGKAFLLLTRRDRSRMRDLEHYTKSVIPQGKIPTSADMIESKAKNFAIKVKASIQEEGNEQYEKIVEQLKEEGFYTHHIMAALMRMQMGGERKSQFTDWELSDDKPAGRDTKFSTRDRGARAFESRTEGRSGFGRDRAVPGGTPRPAFREFSGNRDGGSREGGFRDSGKVGGSREGGSREGFAPRVGAGQMGAGQGSGEPGMVRLFINLGRKDNVSPNHIVGAITSEAKIPGRVIGQIDMYDKFSFVEIPQRDVAKVMTGMRGKTINAREASIEIAK